MKNTLLIVYFLIFSSLVKAQTIIGRVLDSQTHEALPFVSISVKNSTKGILSKEDGTFEITLQNKNIDLIFSSIGYFSKVLNAQNVKEVYLTQKSNSLNEVVVFSINPAHRIIEAAIRNKPINDPEQQTSFRYEVYHKSIVSTNIDSKDDNAKLGKTLKNNDLFINESYAIHKYVRPNLNKEIITGSRTSGTKSTLFSSLTPLLQQFSFYRDFIQFQGRQLQEQLIYVNPLSVGTFGRYDFNLLDTLILETGDSTFIIDFEPKPKSNFVGLKGTLHIHSGDFALQYVRSEPVETDLLHFKLEQIYEQIDGKIWFPKELSAEWLLSEFKIGGESLKLNIHSSLKNIEIGIRIPITDFDENSLEFKPDAIFQDDSFWKTHRNDSLSLREKHTYQYHNSMSFGQKFKQTAVISGSEWFLSGVIPLGKKLDLSIQNLFDANVYEGIRPTLNVLTNDNFSKFIRLDAKAGYGFNDRAFKYEGRIRLNLNEKNKIKLNLSYRNDISEPGNVQYFIWNFPQIPYELIRTFQIARADSLSQLKAELNFRALRYATFSVSLIDEIRKPTYKYTYHNPMHDPMNPLMRDFHTTEIGIGFRYAFGEQFSQIGRGSIITTTPSPTFSLHFAQGVLYFPEGKLPYTKLNTKIEYNFKNPNLGETFINLSAGKIWGHVPYPYLFNGRGSRDNSNFIWVANHFQTMGLYEFTSDQYANLFITHSFGNLLAKPRTKWFRPEVAIFQGIAVGNVSNREAHDGVELKGLEKGYFETGLIIDNLIRKRFAKLFYIGAGIGAFRRWGANELTNTSDNWTYRLVWNVAF